jgi:CDP-diacylglycerol--glycerol-3-phosphate 3-phosphatidyltransferase
LFAKNLKPRALAIIRPLTNAFIRSGIHPNALTMVGLLVSCWAAWIYADGSLVWAGAVLMLAGLFDVLDGAVAREGHRITKFGAFLDSNIDRYAEIVVFLGILVRFTESPWTQLAAFLTITGSLMVSYSRARAEGLGESVSGGLLQRPERVLLLVLGSLAGEAGLRTVLWIMAGLTHGTTLQRILGVRMSLRGSGGHSRAEEEDPGEQPPMEAREAGALPPA